MRKRKPNIINNKQLSVNADIFLARAQKEWDTLQKTARREVMLQRAKNIGCTTASILLSLIALGGIITVATVAPNVFGAVGKSMKRTTFINKHDFYKNKDYLTKRGLLKIKKQGNDMYTLSLTPRGATVFLKKTYRMLSIPKQNMWDRKWRIVLFDIPEKHKSEREALRKKLRLLGFYQLQRSAFVYPHPCFEEIKCIVSLLSIAQYVKFIETSSLVDDHDIKESFRLSE